MKSLRLSFCLVISTVILTTLNGLPETFCGPTTPNNRLLIPSGNTLIITGVLVGSDNWVYSARNEIIVKGTNIFTTHLRYWKWVAGPAEIIVTQTNTVVGYKLLATTNIFTVITSTNQPTIIDVPSGKTLTFAPDDDGYANIFQVTIGSNVRMVLSSPGMQFAGPIRFSTVADSTGAFPSYFISYLQTDDSGAVALPALGLLGLPAGSSQIIVEKSSNLTDWAPVVLQPVRNAETEFYRLRVSR